MKKLLIAILFIAISVNVYAFEMEYIGNKTPFAAGGGGGGNITAGTVAGQSTWWGGTTWGPSSFLFNTGSAIGIDTTGPDAKLDILNITGPQMRHTYSKGSVYVDYELDSSGVLSIEPSGGQADFYFDIATDQHLNSDTNTFLGIGVAGAGLLDDTVPGEGENNIGFGMSALYDITTGYNNAAIGTTAGESITTGYNNTMIGRAAADKLSTGNSNIAIGQNALSTLTTGNGNIALGKGALEDFTGNYAVAIGNLAGFVHATGNEIVGIGAGVLQANVTGNGNVGVGYFALRYSTGGNNTAIGNFAGYGVNGSATYSDNTLLGHDTGRGLSSGSQNILIGSLNNDTLTTGTGNIQIGYDIDTTAVTTSNELNIGGAILGDLSTGDVSIVGSVKSAGIYGSIYVADGSTAQSIPTGATYTKLTGYTINGLSSNMTADVANDKLTITEAGVYMMTVAMSSSAGTSGVEFKCAGFVNGVEQDQVHFERKFPINDVGAAPMAGTIDVTTVGWDVDIRCKHDNGSAVDYTLHYSNITLTYEGET